MRTLIFFREGLSGHYLKSIITDSNREINFRVDPWLPGVDNQIQLQSTEEDCVCLHPKKLNIIDVQQLFDLTLTIQVNQHIYHGIYNNFYKKFLIENPGQQRDFIHWQNNFVYWYDITFYNIKEYYHLFKQDLVTNTISNVINFDNMLDVDYIEYVIKLYFNRPITNNIRQIISTYKNLQLSRNLSGNEQHMADIISSLTDQDFLDSPWFASYCIFKYETNNNLNEYQRQWSIDNTTGPIDKNFLLSIADQYHTV